MKKVTKNQLLNQFFNLELEKRKLEREGLDLNNKKISYQDLVTRVNEINFQQDKLQLLILNFNKK